MFTFKKVKTHHGMFSIQVAIHQLGSMRCQSLAVDRIGSNWAIQRLATESW
jgi:hypothetical protein